MPNLSVRYVRLEGKKKDIPPEQLKRATIKEIESIKAVLTISQMEARVDSRKMEEQGFQSRPTLEKSSKS